MRALMTVRHEQHQHPTDGLLTAVGSVGRNQRDELEARDRGVDAIAGDPPDGAQGVLINRPHRFDPVGLAPAWAGRLSDAVHDHAATGVGHGGDVLRQLRLLLLLGLGLVTPSGQRQLPLPVQVLPLGHSKFAGSLNHLEGQVRSRLPQGIMQRGPRHGTTVATRPRRICRQPNSFGGATSALTPRDDESGLDLDGEVAWRTWSR